MDHSAPTPRKISTARLLVSGSIALVVVVILSWAVGWQGNEKGFNWELASIFGTALGTTLLAVATGALALLTSRDVSATQELARLGREDQVTRERPIVVVHSAGVNGSWNQGHLSVEVVNIGLGPALRVLVEGRYGGEGEPEIVPFLLPTLAPGQRFPMALPVRFPDEPTPETGAVRAEPFAVSGTCLDRHRRPFALLSQWSAGPHYGPRVEPDVL